MTTRNYRSGTRSPRRKTVCWRCGVIHEKQDFVGKHFDKCPNLYDPNYVPESLLEKMPGRDWACEQCGFKNFAKRYDCFQCSTARDDAEEQDGNNQGWSTWNCDNCGGTHPKDTYLKCPHPERQNDSRGGQWQDNNKGGQWQDDNKKRGGGWQNSGWQDNSGGQWQSSGGQSPKFSKGQYKNAKDWNSGGQQQAQQGGQSWSAGVNWGGQGRQQVAGGRQGAAAAGNKGGGGGSGMPKAPQGLPPQKAGWTGKTKEEQQAQPVDESNVKCDGCNLMVHYSKMMKTHQLGGNVRKEYRCPGCHEDYQMGVYASQMLESVYTCSSNMDRFGNWAENEEVKTALLQLLEKGIEQLGLTMRAVPPEREVAEGEETPLKAGEGSVTTTESQWEILEQGGQIILEQATESAEGYKEPVEQEPNLTT